MSAVLFDQEFRTGVAWTILIEIDRRLIEDDQVLDSSVAVTLAHIRRLSDGCRINVLEKVHEVQAFNKLGFATAQPFSRQPVDRHENVNLPHQQIPPQQSGAHRLAAWN